LRHTQKSAVDGTPRLGIILGRGERAIGNLLPSFQRRINPSVISKLRKSWDPIMAQHGIFYMENAGGHKPAHPETTLSTAADERQPSCFALEEEKGEHWNGSGAMARVINEARPSL
jgi:hypothetical protein